MSLEHQLPILMKKTQMSGERAQCGLTSLLPMSCRGRAEAFARRLHTRLRNLGGAERDDAAGESRWLASAAAAAAAVPRRDATDLFFDFELECESPSSPVDDYDPPFPDRSPSEESDAPFYDVDSEPELAAAAAAAAAARPERSQPRGKLPEASAAALPTPPPITEGFVFSSAFYTDRSPIKSQPAPRDNGLVDGRLYSAITFDDCERRDTSSVDETDCAPPPPVDLSRLTAAPFASVDSDSEFESAKSELVDVADEAIEVTVASRLDDVSSDRFSEMSVCIDDLSVEEHDNVEDIPKQESEEILNHIEDNLKQELTEVHNHIEGIPKLELSQQNTEVSKVKQNGIANLKNECEKETGGTLKVEVTGSTPLQITTYEVADDREKSPTPHEDPALLRVEAAEEVPEARTEAEEEVEERPQRVRRCSSLKTGKTPPGTPGRKKIVRFADVLGLDLADVKTFMDEIPVIPKSAYEDLSNADLAFGSPPVRAAVRRPGALSLVPLFQASRDVTEALETRCVCLESARVAEGPHMSVCGSVRVRNLDFHKTVHVRYTMDGWKTYTDLQATYATGTCDGFSDRFTFALYAPSISAGRRLELAVRFQCKGCQYWDNNFGANYCFDCLPFGAQPRSSSSACARAPPLHPTRDWHPSFY